MIATDTVWDGVAALAPLVSRNASTWQTQPRSAPEPRFTLRRFTRAVGALELDAVDFCESDIECAGQPSVWPEPATHVPIAVQGNSLLQDVEVRLRELRTQFVEDFGRELEASSQFALKALLLSTRGLRKPMLSATPSGHIVATWRLDASSISIRLLRPTEIHFAFSGRTQYPNPYGKAAAATFFSEIPAARQLATAA